MRRGASRRRTVCRGHEAHCGRDFGDVGARFPVGRHAAILDDPVRPGVVGRERKARVAKSFELRAEIPRGSIKVLNGVPGIGYTKSPRGRGHELPETLRTFWRKRARVEGAFRPDKLCEKPGERHRVETGRAWTAAAGVAQGYVLRQLRIGTVAFAAGDDAGPTCFGCRIFITLRLALAVDENLPVRPEL